jgi:hypothetical protein
MGLGAVGAVSRSLAVCGKTWTSSPDVAIRSRLVYRVEALYIFEPPRKSSSQSPSPRNGGCRFFILCYQFILTYIIFPPPHPTNTRTAIICLNSYLLEIQELVNRVYSFDLPMIHTRNLTSPQLVSIL